MKILIIHSCDRLKISYFMALTHPWIMPLTIMCSISERMLPQHSCSSRKCFQNDAEARFLRRLWKTERNAILPPYCSVLGAYGPEIPPVFCSGSATALWSHCCYPLHVVNDMKQETVRWRSNCPTEKDRMRISVGFAAKPGSPHCTPRKGSSKHGHGGGSPEPPHPRSLGTHLGN